jgi:hypothetical protein
MRTSFLASAIVTMVAINSSACAAVTAAAGLTHLFTATVHLAQPYEPIPLISGSFRVIEPLQGGSICGPAFRGTIDGGLAIPLIVFDQETQQVSAQFDSIYVYGHADDGSPFYLEQSGIGASPHQNSKVQLQAGGKYQELQRTFILGQPQLNEARTIATVPCYSVELE